MTHKHLEAKAANQILLNDTLPTLFHWEISESRPIRKLCSEIKLFNKQSKKHEQKNETPQQLLLEVLRRIETSYLSHELKGESAEDTFAHNIRGSWGQYLIFPKIYWTMVLSRITIVSPAFSRFQMHFFSSELRNEA